jgi:hypothetical protein
MSAFWVCLFKELKNRGMYALAFNVFPSLEQATPQIHLTTWPRFVARTRQSAGAMDEETSILRRYEPRRRLEGAAAAMAADEEGYVSGCL